MIFKSTTELRFQHSREPMPTVEIDLDSLPSHGGYCQLVQDVLSDLARRVPDLLATVYVHECVRVNFGEQGYSALFGVIGPAMVREALYAGFKAMPGIKLRRSDHITSAEALCQYHLEDGMLWFPYEAYTWCADESTAAPVPATDVTKEVLVISRRTMLGWALATMKIPLMTTSLGRLDRSRVATRRRVRTQASIPFAARSKRSSDCRPAPSL